MLLKSIYLQSPCLSGSIIRRMACPTVVLPSRRRLAMPTWPSARNHRLCETGLDSETTWPKPGWSHQLVECRRKTVLAASAKRAGVFASCSSQPEVNAASKPQRRKEPAKAASDRRLPPSRNLARKRQKYQSTRDQSRIQVTLYSRGPHSGGLSPTLGRIVASRSFILGHA